ncbi:MAG: hypothetical protein DMG65_19985 [Candidatus Angelobacter sp. Gp1-AA117]|nr:MAG: hypothetical protein DMG65_19985 [Candidatus Angelobacter sp. Gp1-AA117]
MNPQLFSFPVRQFHNNQDHYGAQPPSAAWRVLPLGIWRHCICVVRKLSHGNSAVMVNFL